MVRTLWHTFAQRRLIIVPIVVALTLAACSTNAPPRASKSSTTVAAAAPGLTKTTITVGQADDLSNPRGQFPGANDGTLTYFDYINSLGGVNGRKIELDAENTGDMPTVAGFATQTEIAHDFALVGGYSIDDFAEKPFISKANMPVISVPADPSVSDLPTSYSPLPDTANDYPLVILRALKAKFPTAAAHVGILWDRSTRSSPSSEKVWARAARSAGLTIVSQGSVSSGQTTFLPNVLAMKAMGVDLLVTTALSDAASATLAQELQEQQLFPTVVTEDAYSPTLVSEGGAALDNVYLATDHVLYLDADAGLPAVRLFDKWMTINDPHASFQVQALYGWVSAQLFVEALRRPGPLPTRSRLEAALDGITNFDAGGLIGASDPAHNVPSACAILSHIRSGRVDRIPPTPTHGFLCAPGALLPAPGFKPEKRTTTASL